MNDRDESRAGETPRPAPRFGEYAPADEPQAAEGPATGAQAGEQSGGGAPTGDAAQLGGAQAGASQPPASPGPQGGADPAAPPADAAPVAPARPAPAYGEYAPEGWQWSLDEGDGGASSSGAPAPSEPAGPVPPSRPAANLDGVPHNLGVPGASTTRAPRTETAPHGLGTSQGPSQQGATPSATHHPPQYPGGPAAGQRPGDSRFPGEPQPYRAAAPPPAPSPNRSGPASGGLIADRVISIVLLAIGAYGALNTAFSLFELPGFLSMSAEMLGIAEITPPQWVASVGVIGALVQLALYAVTLIFTVQRMRARKLAFAFPLIAGVLSVAITLVIITVALLQTPEFLQFSFENSGQLPPLGG